VYSNIPLICSYALSRAQWGKIQTQKVSVFINDFGEAQTTLLSFKEKSIPTISYIASQSKNSPHSHFFCYF